MKSWQKLLVLIDSEEHAAFTVTKALALRDFAGARLTFLRLYYDDTVDRDDLAFSAEEHDHLVRLESEAEQIKFEHFVARHATDRTWRSEVCWAVQPLKAILAAAHREQCDVILKDARVERSDAILLQEAGVPVMMIKPAAWRPGAPIVAAVDVADPEMSERNRRVLEHAQGLTRMLGGMLHVMNTLSLSADRVAAHRNEPEFEEDLAYSKAGRLAQLEHLLKPGDAAGVHIQVEEGPAGGSVAEVVRTVDAEFLVIGKSRRNAADTLDSTSQTLLRRVGCDVLSVP